MRFFDGASRTAEPRASGVLEAPQRVAEATHSLAGLQPSMHSGHKIAQISAHTLLVAPAQMVL